MRCPDCGGYEFDSNGICLNTNCPGKQKRCAYNSNPIRPRPDIGKVDIFKLADGLSKKKKEQDIPSLSPCPWCSQHSLHYEIRTDSFTCLNRECTMFNKPIMPNMKEFKIIFDRLKGKQR
jgi:hypothetical protein